MEWVVMASLSKALALDQYTTEEYNTRLCVCLHQ
jgi:hypothetical protein